MPGHAFLRASGSGLPSGSMVRPRKHTPNAATGIRDVSGIPRDEVHGLPVFLS